MAHTLADATSGERLGVTEVALGLMLAGIVVAHGGGGQGMLALSRILRTTGAAIHGGLVEGRTSATPSSGGPNRWGEFKMTHTTHPRT